MANTKVTGDLIASGTITAANLVSGTLDTLLDNYLTTNTYATQGYVTSAVNNLIDAAPASLDTLNELAAALNDDANFATTVTNALATKLNLSGGTLTGGLHINTTSLPQLLIQNVDGGTNAERIAIEVTSGDIFKIRSLNDNNTTRTDNIITANIINGNVGIGATSPSYKLDIGSGQSNYIRLHNASSGDISSGLIISRGSTGLGLQLYDNPFDNTTTFRVGGHVNFFYAGSSYNLFLDGGNGRVGIGTSSPAQKLEINGAVRISGSPAIELTGSGTGTYNKTVIYNDQTYGFLLESTKATDSGTAAKKPITLTWRGGFNANGGINLIGDTKLVTNDTGLGVDKTSPDSKLEIANADGSSYRFGYNGTSDVYIDAGTTYFRTANGGSNTVTIDSVGNLGIDTTSPGAKLEIYGTGNTLRLDSAANQSKTILFRNVGTATAEIKTDGNLKLWAEDAGRNIYFDTSGGTKMTILSSGNVGIGTTDPKTKLQVNGPIGMRDGSGEPKNARFVKTGTSSVSFNISVGAVGAWRAGHAFLKVSGAQNGLQEHHSAWYHLKLVHYYLSGVTQSGTSNPALIKDSGGDTGSYTLSVTSTGSSNPQVITITISDANGSTNSMIADIDATFFEGIQSIS